MTLQLRNPHSVLAALRHRPRDVAELRAPAGEPGEAWAAVLAAAREAGVPLRRPDSAPPGRRRGRGSAPPAPGRDTAASALVKERGSAPLDALFDSPAEHEVYLALDQIQDPQNVGAIFRTAAFFGVRGVVLPRDRSAPLTGAVYDVASGGLEAVPFAQVANLRQALARARDAGVWVLGTSERADASIDDVPRDRPWIAVLGNEERGLRRLTLDQCDLVCRIARPEPAPGAPDEPAAPVASLNVSVAAGIVLAALRRRA